MAEEHRCQAQEGHRLCANNCGFFGSPATMNLCSKCYGDLCLKQQQQASMKSAVEASLSTSSSSSSSSPAVGSTLIPEPAPITKDTAGRTEIAEAEVAAAASVVTEESAPKTWPNRCSVCWKRVGLTGFRCRCGITFCGTHRYPEKHGCSFDFKSLGREEIAKANPVVKAAKLDKI